MSRGARELGQAEVHTEGLQGESRTALALKRVGCGAVDSREGCPREGGAGVSKADAYSGRVARTPRVCSDGSPGAVKVMGITVAK